MYAAVTARHTHRGGFGASPLPTGTISALREEAAREGAMLRLVTADDQRDALAAAVQAAEHALRLNGRRAAEQASRRHQPGLPRQYPPPHRGCPALNGPRTPGG
jgi:hypothetical protein